MAGGLGLWWGDVHRSFYHVSVWPLLLLTAVLARLARPATTEERPKQFGSFQAVYLSVWAFCVAADWLQGPYVYALYSAYGFSGQRIAQLFVCGFASSLVFGGFVGSITDKFGRKKCCLAYCLFYILSCITKHFNSYSVLMVGRITGGIATSMLFSCFECWMVSEHLQRHRFSPGLLSYMFGLMFNTMYCVAIVAGLTSQLLVDAWELHPVSAGSSFHIGGFCTPFDLAIVCLLVGGALISLLWEENYGAEDAGAPSQAGLLENFGAARRLLASDASAGLLCAVVACFEGAMYAFVFNWTPALQSRTTPPPHGLIFALFMMACMCGASAATISGGALQPTTRLILVLAAGIVAFVVPAWLGGRDGFLIPVFAAFLLFEFCVGAYFPTIGVLKSQIVPEQIRGTMYNIYRVPLNAVVVCLLLTNISMASCFCMCACLLAVALVAVGFIAARRCSDSLPGDLESCKDV